MRVASLASFNGVESSDNEPVYIAIFFEIVQPAAASADSLTQGSGAGEGVITS